MKILKFANYEEMSAAADLKVPLEIDVNIGTNWYESK